MPPARSRRSCYVSGEDGPADHPRRGCGARAPRARARPQHGHFRFSDFESPWPADLLDALAGLKGAWFCDSYARFEHPNYLRKQIDQILDFYGIALPGLRILDFGCGFGASSYGLVRRGATDVVATDLVGENIAFARTLFSRLGLDGRIDLRREDLVPALEPASFDVVWLQAVVEHLLPDERRSYLRQFWRALRPGGWLVVTETPNRVWPYDDAHERRPLVPAVDAGGAHLRRRCGGRSASPATPTRRSTGRASSARPTASSSTASGGQSIATSRRASCGATSPASTRIARVKTTDAACGRRRARRARTGRPWPPAPACHGVHAVSEPRRLPQSAGRLAWICRSMSLRANASTRRAPSSAATTRRSSSAIARRAPRRCGRWRCSAT